MGLAIASRLELDPGGVSQHVVEPDHLVASDVHCLDSPAALVFDPLTWAASA